MISEGVTHPVRSLFPGGSLTRVGTGRIQSLIPEGHPTQPTLRGHSPLDNRVSFMRLAQELCTHML